MFRRLPVIKHLLAEARHLHVDRTKPRFGLAAARLNPGAAFPYPIDMTPLLAFPFGHLDERGVLFNVGTDVHGGVYQPTSIAQYAIAQWNAWLEDGDEARLVSFMTQAHWLLEHETRLANGSGVWPIPFPSAGYGATGPWLSGLTQGNIVSVFVRAYHHTRDIRFLESARRAVRSFELDIFEGGVSAPVADGGMFFEEAATYPASRILNGYVLALFGLLDYVRLTGDEEVERLAQASIDTFHDLLPSYDLGYWSSYDLLHRRPASRFYHTLHIMLLRALSEYTGCAHCGDLAGRWDGYQRSAWNRARYYITSRARRYQAKFVAQRAARARRRAGLSVRASGPARVLAAVTGFPIAGGMRSVLAGISEVMRDQWAMEYLTRAVGADASDYRIHPYQRRYTPLGREATSPSQYPNMLLYEREGRRMMRRLMRAGGYQLALPQDGAYTAAYLGATARRYGARVVTMDHGTITRPYSAAFKEQREAEARRYGQPRQAIERLRDALYMRTVRRYTRVAVKSSDTFLVAGDEVQDVYVRRYGVSPGLIVRYPYWVDGARFAPPGDAERAELRRRLNLPDRPVIISLISRLAEEKGFDLALAALDQAFALVGADAAPNVGVVIAGSGPMRGRIEAEIEARGLVQACLLFGEASAAQVADLLRASDIFLYAGKRGTNYSVAVLEAMAAGCAVVATASPISNTHLLAEGRGVALSLPADAPTMAAALARLVVSEDTRRRMGAAARAYVQERHSALALRQALWRATGWAPDLAALTSAAPEQTAEQERAR